MNHEEQNSVNKMSPEAQARAEKMRAIRQESQHRASQMTSKEMLAQTLSNNSEATAKPKIKTFEQLAQEGQLIRMSQPSLTRDQRVKQMLKNKASRIKSELGTD